MKSYDKHINGVPSLYTISETPQGFTVEAPHRTAVLVEVEDNSFVLRGNFTHQQLAYFSDIEVHALLEAKNGPLRICSLFRFRLLLDLVVACLMVNWRPRYDLAAKDGEKVHNWGDVRHWAIKQTRGVVRSRIFQQWQRLLDQTDPQVRDVHRRMFSVCFSTYMSDSSDLWSRIENWEELYTRKNLVHDLLNHKAAVVAAGRWFDFDQLSANIKYEFTFEGPVSSLRVSPIGVDRISVLDGLDDWRALYSPSGLPNTNLTQTLMQLPGGVPPSLLTSLNRIELERPIRDRLELTMLLASIKSNQGLPSRNQSIFMYAARHEIIDAMSLMEIYLLERLSPRKTRHILRFAKMLNDFPEVHHGGIIAMCNKSIQWHRELSKR